jgi:hypothetical protein
MTPPKRSSVSPLPGIASRPGYLPRPVSMVEMLRQIIAWWRGTRPTLRERQIEAAQIEALAELENDPSGRRGKHA